MDERKSNIQRYKDFIDRRWQMWWFSRVIKLTKQPISAVLDWLPSNLESWMALLWGHKYNVNVNDRKVIQLLTLTYFVSFRQKVFEDIQRFINTKDIINKVVFDLENDRCASNN